MAEKKESKEAEDNVIFVGNKPPMSYVLACVTQFNDGAPEIHIKARGKAISRAVDVAEITRNRFEEDAEVDDIEIGTEVIETDEGEEINVSSMDITLKK